MTRRVAVVFTGGTIAMAGGPNGATPTYDAHELLAEVPLGPGVEAHPVSFMRTPGAHLSLDDVVELAQFVSTALEDHDGVVVVQGTDTIEETAFALHLLVDEPRRVVVTGAMRPADAPGADGPANLADAVAAAGHPRLDGYGVVVVFASEIHAAALVRKTHPFGPAAFSSTTGPLGWVVEGAPVLLAAPVREWRLPAPVRAGPVARVAVVRAYMGMDAGALPSGHNGYAGLVVEALGAGHVPIEVADRLAKDAAAVPVVLCSRTGGGPPLRATYGFVGSERDLLERGLIHGGVLDGPKAGVALALLLTGGTPWDDIEHFFSL